MKPTKDLFI